MCSIQPMSGEKETGVGSLRTEEGSTRLERVWRILEGERSAR